MKANLAFGKTGLAIALPDTYHYRVLQARSAQPLANLQNALASALQNPIAGPSLADLARGKRSAAISICDITRPAPNALTLPPLLACLEDAGIRRDAITILISP